MNKLVKRHTCREFFGGKCSVQASRVTSLAFDPAVSDRTLG
ncbi:MAG: hypothetical protein RIE73_12725 [Coleofasciculus sp. C1-SOL-03]|jgi:hypothetical protein